MEYKVKDVSKINESSLSSKNIPLTIKYLDTSNITNGKVKEIVEFDVENEKIPSRARRIVKENDFIYSTVRPNQNHYGFIDESLKETIVSTGFIVVSPNTKIVNPYFLYLYCTQNTINEKLQMIAENSTTTYPSIKASDLGELKINLPDIKIQERNSNFIKYIDKKIENNEKIIKNLEQISQTLFKRWFIDYEFPNEGGKPYKSSGGEMVESELGEIPEGWNIGYISNIATIVMGQSPKSNTYNNEQIGLPLINGAADLKNGIVIPNKYTSDPKKIGEIGDFVFGVRATIGRITELNSSYAIGRGVGIAKYKNIHEKEFLKEILKISFNSFEKTSSGSVYINISKNDISNYKIVIPTERIMRNYSSFNRNNYIEIENLKKQNSNLEKLSESLLPKLLSGEIEIPEDLEV